MTIVGILADVNYSKLDAEAMPEIFVAYEQAPDLYGAEIAARTAGDPAAMAPTLRKLIADIDPALPIFDMKTLDHSPIPSRPAASTSSSSPPSQHPRWHSRWSPSTE